MTGYEAQARLEGDEAATWDAVAMSMDEGRLVGRADKGLPGHSYLYRVCAVNQHGSGTFSEASEPLELAPVPPHPPTDVKHSDTRPTGIKLVWKPPKNNGGKDIEAYALEQHAGPIEHGQQTAWLPVTLHGTVGVGAKPNAHVAALEPGTHYSFRIAAKNSAGRGEWSKPHSVTTTADVPHTPTVSVEKLAPTFVELKVDGTVGTTFGLRDLAVELRHCDEPPSKKPPVADSAHVTQFEYIERPETDATHTDAETPPPCTIIVRVDELEPNKGYCFTARFINGFGDSGYSEWCRAVHTPATVPERPGTPLMQDNSAEGCILSWDLPSSSGGEPILSYDVQSKDLKSSEWLEHHLWQRQQHRR